MNYFSGHKHLILKTNDKKVDPLLVLQVENLWYLPTTITYKSIANKKVHIYLKDSKTPFIGVVVDKMINLGKVLYKLQFMKGFEKSHTWFYQDELISIKY